MSVVKSSSLAIKMSLFYLFSQTALAELPPCGSVPTGQACHFTNVVDFSGGDFIHVSFDTIDEQTPASIIQKYENIATFAITGASGDIRHTSIHAYEFPGADTAGGAISGEYRIDLGYFGKTDVTVSFNTPIDSAGGFFGGSVGLASVTVVLEDGSSHVITRTTAGIPAVPGSTPSLLPECTAINGFLGVDSAGGPKIVKTIFSSDSDASSLDSLFFGTAQGGSHGAGVYRFAESAITTKCTAYGYVTPPILPQSTLLSSDSDGDGIPDVWEQQYGYNPYDPSDALLDTDGDGVNNLYEFTHGTDPTVVNINPPNIMHGNTVVQGALHLTPLSSPPVTCSTDSEGSIYYDSPSIMLLICDGVEWKEYRGPQGAMGPAGPSGSPGLPGAKGDSGDKGKDAVFADITCATNQIIRYNGTSWECATDFLGVLSLNCRDGDTIMLKNGTWQCAHLPGQGIGNNKFEHEHRKNSDANDKHKH